MTKIPKIYQLAVLCFVALVLFIVPKSASAYNFGGYTFTATHCNEYSCYSETEANAIQVLKYGLAKGKLNYVHSMTCGNTVTINVTKCPVVKTCNAKGELVTRKANCKNVKSACPCGCANGDCVECTCTGDGCGAPTGGGGSGGDGGGGGGGGDSLLTTTTNACPNGVNIFPFDFVGPLQPGEQRSTKTYADCSTPGDTPPGDGVEPICKYLESDGTCSVPVIDLGIFPSIISKGGSCKIVWKVEKAEVCNLDGMAIDENDISEGEESVSPEDTATYKLSCTNGPQISSKEVTCGVQDVTED
jgi:hypothetical protein